MVYKNTKTYKSGFLDVGQNHKIYYELSGNPKGKPVLFIHGGPGAGFTQKDKKFFNPKKFNIIHFAQRGAGKSTPFASIKNNTTKHLVEDINKLLDFLQIEKTMLFGGSWGSTLALVYAINNPKRVKAMVLRGIFLGSKQENEYFTYESKNTHPESWTKVAKMVPKKYIRKKQIEKYFYKMINSKNKAKSQKYADAWAEFEFSLSRLQPDKKKILKAMKEAKPAAFSRIELHYLTHKCFLSENYILKNTHKISHLPTAIVHGRYDCVCRPLAAYRLHKALKKSKIYFTFAGHSAYEKDTETQLIKEMDKFSK